MLLDKPWPEVTPLREAINRAYRMDETECVEHLLQQATLPASTLKNITDRAHHLVSQVRSKQLERGGIDSFLYEYDLSSAEGVTLMCLAEALLRIPDKHTINRLLRDKLTSADWKTHLKQSDSFFVNAATWGLVLTGRILQSDEPTQYFQNTLKRFLSRSSEPVIRSAVGQAMKIMSRQFVMGRDIKEALHRAVANEKRGYRYSYDMLGEVALTAEDADRYYEAYQNAIEEIGKASKDKDVITGPGISIKLSALHPRYQFAQHDRVLEEIVPRLFSLAQHAKEVDIALTIDAEEAERLDLSLDIIEQVFADPSLANWQGFGVAVQTYQKRAWYVLDWLADLARHQRSRLKIRLIKGAYWDTEIKLSQIQGLRGYPVFTRKSSTDVSFQACAKKVLEMTDVFYPQFATHNAYSVALIMELIGHKQHDFEFQCLHGMGQVLYDEIVSNEANGIPCRIYAPVGNHSDLLPYLVRRLLENGANTSFVNRIIDREAPIETLIADPVAIVKQLKQKPHPYIPLPCDIYGESRKNSKGIDLTNRKELQDLDDQLKIFAEKTWQVAPIIAGKESFTKGEPCYSPSDRKQLVGYCQDANKQNIENALHVASDAFVSWQATAVSKRSDYLRKAADLLEQHCVELIALAIREAGKTIPDALGEVREAIDFCRYYAEQADKNLQEPLLMPGYTGESNHLHLCGRGVLLCISPWNFPVAIFIGQIVACLATGNCVIAKPAEQTPLVAGVIIRLLHQAGIPKNVLHLLPGRGETVGAPLVADTRVQGVIFTGSTETARHINQTLANREGAIALLIAETGGQNVMIVDSSALLEQVVIDALESAFGSAGQRCSALRVLFVQEEIADRLIKMLQGAMAELQVGDPALLSTDIGPVIDEQAKQVLEQHITFLQEKGKLIYQVPLLPMCTRGTFFAPQAYELESISLLKREVFGPILHVVRYAAKELDQVINAVNNTRYGLTLGIHSRVNETIHYIQQRMRVGNCYVNRNMVGAVVGVQPFGGEGLSGTGPKAGGPHYLYRLCNERTVTVDTTAAGGNASLLSLTED